jgi:hypothetical protein
MRKIAHSAAEHLGNKESPWGRIAWLYRQRAAAQAVVGDPRGAAQTIAENESDPLCRCQALAWICEFLCARDQEEVTAFLSGEAQ